MHSRGRECSAPIVRIGAILALPATIATRRGSRTPTWAVPALPPFY